MSFCFARQVWHFLTFPCVCIKACAALHTCLVAFFFANRSSAFRDVVTIGTFSGKCRNVLNDAPHSALYSLHSRLWSLIYILHFRPRTLHLTLYTPHSILYTSHSKLYTLHSTLDTPHSTLYTPFLTLHASESAFTHSTQRSILHTLYVTLYTWDPEPHTLHFKFHTEPCTL